MVKGRIPQGQRRVDNMPVLALECGTEQVLQVINLQMQGLITCREDAGDLLPQRLDLSLISYDLPRNNRRVTYRLDHVHPPTTGVGHVVPDPVRERVLEVD